VDVARILERFARQPKSLGRNNERVHLVAASRAVSANLIVERDNVVSVERAE